MWWCSLLGPTRWWLVVIHDTVRFSGWIFIKLGISSVAEMSIEVHTVVVFCYNAVAMVILRYVVVMVTLTLLRFPSLGAL